MDVHDYGTQYDRGPYWNLVSAAPYSESFWTMSIGQRLVHLGQNLRFMPRSLDTLPNTAVSLRGLALHPVPTWLSLTILELSTVWM